MKDQRISIGPWLTKFPVGVRHSNLFLAIGVGLCCSAGLLLTAGYTLKQLADIDPYVYAGYIHDYPGLLNRLGRTYYSTRIAYIYPERALSFLFGLEGGYFAFRLLALASAVAAVFAIGIRFGGYATAILAAVWLSFAPWLPRSLLWTYPDGIAVVYMLVGIAFLIVPTKRRLVYHVAAGAAFALAINCNLILLAFCGLLGPGWAFFYRREGIVWLARGRLLSRGRFFCRLSRHGLASIHPISRPWLFFRRRLNPDGVLTHRGRRAGVVQAAIFNHLAGQKFHAAYPGYLCAGRAISCRTTDNCADTDQRYGL